MESKSYTDAPASVTYSITRGGFDLLFTVRSDTGLDLLAQMNTIEKKLKEEGYEPQTKRGGYPKKEVIYIDGKKCPTCGSRLVKVVSKDGKQYEKCEKQVYDFRTKTTTGCLYFSAI